MISDGIGNDEAFIKRIFYEYLQMLFTTLCGGLLPDCFVAQFTVLNLTSRIHTCPGTESVRPDHSNGNSMPYSLRIVCGFFNVPQLFATRVVRRDLRLIVLIREDFQV